MTTPEDQTAAFARALFAPSKQPDTTTATPEDVAAWMAQGLDTTTTSDGEDSQANGED